MEHKQSLVWANRAVAAPGEVEDYDFEKQAAIAASLAVKEEQYDSEDDYKTGEHQSPQEDRRQKQIRGSPSVNPLRGWRRK